MEVARLAQHAPIVMVQQAPTLLVQQAPLVMALRWKRNVQGVRQQDSHVIAAACHSF
jgi:hypothetical protein